MAAGVTAKLFGGIRIMQCLKHSTCEHKPGKLNLEIAENQNNKLYCGGLERERVTESAVCFRFYGPLEKQKKERLQQMSGK